VRPTHLAVDVEHGVVVRSWDVRVARDKLLARTEQRCVRRRFTFLFPWQRSTRLEATRASGALKRTHEASAQGGHTAAIHA
jgi:hypothetical protein